VVAGPFVICGSFLCGVSAASASVTVDHPSDGQAGQETGTMSVSDHALRLKGSAGPTGEGDSMKYALVIYNGAEVRALTPDEERHRINARIDEIQGRRS
jgi:hypothetical protein